MATMLGADPDRLDALAAQLSGAARELQALEVRVGNAVRESPWHGLDAEGLRAQWISRDALLVIAAATRLESAATVLVRNATEQRQASAADGGLGVVLGGLSATFSATAGAVASSLQEIGLGLTALGQAPPATDPAADARALYNAVDGPGTDEDAIFAVLAGKTSTEIDAIRQSYFVQFGVRLDDDLRGDFSDTTELDRALLGTLPPRTAEQIMHEYTVAPDPDGTSRWPPIPFLPQRELTGREIDLLEANPDRVLPIRGIGLSAEEESMRQFPAGGPSNGHQDAYRHALASALLTQRYGEPWANAFTTAHEGNPKSAEVAVAMDLYNNEIGRRIAVAHPDATFPELAQLVRQAVESGELTVVGQDQRLHFSNEIPSDATAPANEVLPVGDRSPGKEVPPP